MTPHHSSETPGAFLEIVSHFRKQSWNGTATAQSHTATLGSIVELSRACTPTTEIGSLAVQSSATPAPVSLHKIMNTDTNKTSGVLGGAIDATGHYAQLF
jgi:hypothetical protein